MFQTEVSARSHSAIGSLFNQKKLAEHDAALRLLRMLNDGDPEASAAWDPRFSLSTSPVHPELQGADQRRPAEGRSAPASFHADRFPSATQFLVVIDAENRPTALSLDYPANVRAVAFAGSIAAETLKEKASGSVQLVVIPAVVRGREAADAFIAVWLGKNLASIQEKRLQVVIVSGDVFFNRVETVLSTYQVTCCVDPLLPTSEIPDV